MKVIRTVKEMHKYIAGIKKLKTASSIGFVPTMGYLHKGHISLMEAAGKDNKRVVVSIFVNPTQFAPGEDFEKYPRDEERDIKMLEASGKVDCVFIPKADEMYPEDNAAVVALQNNMPSVLCGASRPSHFAGVTTIVAKLLNVVKPDKLYLGQKDMQQAVILTRMTEDLLYDTEVVICPTEREKDGLAKSSRNQYLSPEERNTAPALYRAIQLAESMIELGEKSSQAIIKEMKRKLKEDNVEIDYIEIVDAKTLEKAETASGRLLIAAAVFIGKTRLIDNTVLEIKE